MKTLYLVTVSFLLYLTGYAQGSTGVSDPSAKKILDAVSTKFKSFKGVQASFTLKIEDSKGKVQGVKKGAVTMKGSKYRITITGQEIFCDGKDVWTYDKSANEVTITALDPTGGITPQKLFTNFYDKDFLYKLNGEKKEAGKVLQEIELTPTDKTRNFHKVYVLVDKKTQTIYNTKILEKGGNKYSYTVNTMNGKATISDNTFFFDKKKYPGVEEIDLR